MGSDETIPVVEMAEDGLGKYATKCSFANWRFFLQGS